MSLSNWKENFNTYTDSEAILIVVSSPANSVGDWEEWSQLCDASLIYRKGGQGLNGATKKTLSKMKNLPTKWNEIIFEEVEEK